MASEPSEGAPTVVFLGGPWNLQQHDVELYAEMGFPDKISHRDLVGAYVRRGETLIYDWSDEPLRKIPMVRLTHD